MKNILAIMLLFFRLGIVAQEPRLVLPVGHTGEVLSALFSPDGKKIVTISTDKTAKIWDAMSGRLIFDFKQEYQIRSAIFSPDSKHLIIITRNSQVTIWNTWTGDSITNLKGHYDVVNFATYSRDGKKIVTASDDLNARIWDAATGKPLTVLKHSQYVLSARFSPDGNRLATIPFDSIVIIWNVKSGKALLELKGHKARVTSATFSADGKAILTTSADKTAKIWHAVKGNLLKNFGSQTKQISRAEFSPDGKQIITISENYTVSIWDVNTGSLTFDLTGHKDRIVSAHYSPDGKSIVTTSADKTTTLWDATSGEVLTQLSGHSNKVNSAFFSPDGKKIITASDDKTAKIWETSSGNIIVDLKSHTSDALLAEFSSDGKNIVVAFDNHTALIYDAMTGLPLSRLAGHQDNITFVDFTIESKKIVTTSKDKTARVWDITTGRLLCQLKGHTDIVNSAKFSLDGNKIVSTSNDTTTKIWDAVSGVLLTDIKGTHPASYSEFTSKDKQVIIGSGGYGQATEWDVATGKFIGKTFLEGRVKQIYKEDIFVPKGLCPPDCGPDPYVVRHIYETIKISDLSPGDKERVTISEDKKVKIYDFKNDKLLYTFYAIDSTDFLVVDGSNRFDGSPGARKQLHYMCNDDVVDLEQLKELSWEPGLVGKIMGVNKEPITAKKLADVNICNVIPRVEEKGYKDGGYLFEISPRDGGLGEVLVYVNNKQIATYLPSELQKDGATYTLQVPQKLVAPYIGSSTDKVELVALTADKQISSQRRGMTVEDDFAFSSAPINLYLITVGVSNYKGESLKLTYASKDADEFSAILGQSAKKLLNVDSVQHVFSYALSTSPDKLWPSKDNIGKTFEEISMKASPNDIIVIFFAGHGVLTFDTKQFYFLTQEASSSKLAGIEKEVAISTEELNKWMRNIRAQKQILILDACNSGEVVNTLEDIVKNRDVPADQLRALERLKDRTGTYILSASASGQAAYESSLFEQGLLTYSLLSGLKYGAALKDKKYIDVTKWFNFAADEVKVLVKDIGGRQSPQVIGTASFDVGIVDKEIIDAIKLSIRKKVFTRSKFIGDQKMLSDDLDLSSLVDARLNEIAGQNLESPFVFVDDNSFKDSYSIRGNYKVTKGQISATILLLHGKNNLVQTFTIIGRTDAKEDFVTAMIQKVEQFINGK